MKQGLLPTIAIIISLSLTGCGSSVDTRINDAQNFDSNNTQEAQKNASFNVAKTVDKDKDDDLSSVVTNKSELERWQKYTKEEHNISIKFHKDWYYDRDEAREENSAYLLLIGFAPTPDFFNTDGPYPIELCVIANKHTKNPAFEEELIIAESDNKIYTLRTIDKEKYGEILKMMKTTFQFIRP